MTDPRNPTYGAAAVSGGNWTQATGEFDQLWGLASWAAPAADACTTVRHGYEDAGWGVVRVKLDGVVVAQDIQQAGTTRAAFPLTWGRLDSTVPEAVTLIPPVIGPLMSWALFEPAAATPHSFTAEFGDTCGLGGGKADAHFRLTDLEIDVVAAR